MDWLKTLYEVLGATYPRLSLVVAAILGALASGGAWWLIGKQYEKERTRTGVSIVENTTRGLPPTSLDTASITPTKEPLQDLARLLLSEVIFNERRAKTFTSLHEQLSSGKELTDEAGNRIPLDLSRLSES